jgi:hypothetical protein
MPDFTIRADSVDVEQIMRQIRGRIRDKRGVDYTEEQIKELAAAKLERFLDPTGVRSDLLEQFRARPSLPPGFLYQFEDTTLFDSDKPIVRFFRRLLHPFLKLLFNPNVLSSALHKQAAFNQYVHAHQPLQFELLHNLVLELTRASIEVKNLKMRLESVQSRLEFNERRARALEAVVQYKPDAPQGGRAGGRDEARRDPHREHPRGQQPQPRGMQPPVPAQGRPPQPQQQQARGPQPQQERPPQTPVEAAAPDEAAAFGTEPQGGVDPITGGESVRTKRRRRRRGRRSTGEQEPARTHAADAHEPAPPREGIGHVPPAAAVGGAWGTVAGGQEATAAGQHAGPDAVGGTEDAGLAPSLRHQRGPVEAADSTREPGPAREEGDGALGGAVPGTWGTLSAVQETPAAGEDATKVAVAVRENAPPTQAPTYEIEHTHEPGPSPVESETRAVPADSPPQDDERPRPWGVPAAVPETITDDEPQ